MYLINGPIPCYVFLFRKINVNRSFLTRYPNSYLAEMFSANSRYTPARLIFTMKVENIKFFFFLTGWLTEAIV